MQMYRLETMSSYNEKAPPLFLEVGIDRFGDGKPYYFKTDLRTIECDELPLVPGQSVDMSSASSVDDILLTAEMRDASFKKDTSEEPSYDKEIEGVASSFSWHRCVLPGIMEFSLAVGTSGDPASESQKLYCDALSIYFDHHFAYYPFDDTDSSYTNLF